jgi:hypothetical protein
MNLAGVTAAVTTLLLLADAPRPAWAGGACAG